jgi:hypothetical protein
VSAVFSKVMAYGQGVGVGKGSDYWTRIMKVFELLQVLLHNREEPIDINQRLIATELFEEDRFSKLFFEVRVFNQRIRMLHPETRKWVEIEQLK